MLQVKDLHFTIGDRDLLKGVNWVVKPGSRVALMGANGAGKTTLLKIVSGLISIDDRGVIHTPKEFRIGYLPQEETLTGKGTVIQEAKKGREDLIKIDNKIQLIQKQLNSTDENESHLLKKMDQYQQQYEISGGYFLDKEAKMILSGLGFGKNDFTRPLKEFSGGLRMRVYLTRLLLQNLDLLLLDEPTNHLDLPSLEWLEQYLLTFPGSIVMVSHDRFFIDRLAEEIYELENGSLTFYSGNYHAYEEKKESNRLQMEKKLVQQSKERRRQETFINRFRAKNTKATQVQSRIKQMEKLEDIEIPQSPVQFLFKIPMEISSFKHILHLKNIGFNYGQEWVLKDLQLDIYRGEKIALVGLNGVGKTTLTRLISGQLSPQEGKVELGERTYVGYYAQHQIDILKPEDTIYDEVVSAASAVCIPRIRDILGIFQIKGDDIYKKIKYLSGGEKARVSLVKILVSPVNFLIMDEPTNHLDTRSKEALEKALLDYQGTLILISHDRYFLDKITTKVIELKDKKIEEYPGNYSYYLEKKDVQKTENDSQATNHFFKKNRDRKEIRRLEAQARQAVSKERNRLGKEIQQTEDKIAVLEQNKREIDSQMSLPETYEDSQKVVHLQKEQSKTVKELHLCYQNWEKAQKALDEIMTQLSPLKK